MGQRRPITSQLRIVTAAMFIVLAACSPSTTDESVVSSTTLAATQNHERSDGGTSTRPTYVRSTPLPDSIVEEASPGPPTPAEEAAFWQCLDDFGYSKADYDQLVPEGSFSEKDDPELSRFMDAIETCINDSGVGYVASLDPAYIAAANESYQIEAQCMQDLGWSDYPVPGENGRLQGGRYEFPTDAEELERYLTDREYCGTQSGMPFFRE